MILNFECFMEQSCIEQPYPESIVKLNDKVIENVEFFRYLGDDIRFDQPSTVDAEIDLRIAFAQNKYNQMSKKRQNRKIYLKTRVYIMNVMVHSRLTYSSQTWVGTLTNNTKKELDQPILACSGEW